jgi:predicted metal-dependent enzyme (double-stranded beta helix superfamily)
MNKIELTITLGNIMSNNALNKFTTELSSVWGPLSSSLTLKSKQLLTELTQNCLEEPWMQALITNKKPYHEVYRNEEHGFILMGHVEQKGDISPPHDHGNGWVLYSTVQGQVEMGIFHKVIKSDGQLSVIQKDSYMLEPGQCSIYLPGDIHDTTSLEDNTVMLRLTSCDFFKEVEEGRLVRFTNNDEKW